MPIFEVRCKVCGKQKEYISKSMGDILESKCCSNCGANFEPVISQPNFALKGVGWSSTGYSKTPEDWKK